MLQEELRRAGDRGGSPVGGMGIDRKVIVFKGRRLEPRRRELPLERSANLLTTRVTSGFKSVTFLRGL